MILSDARIDLKGGSLTLADGGDLIVGCVISGGVIEARTDTVLLVGCTIEVPVPTTQFLTSMPPKSCPVIRDCAIKGTKLPDTVHAITCGITS